MAEGGAGDWRPLTDEVVELLGSGVVMSVATRDAALAPESMPGMGSRVHRDRCHLTVFVPRVLADATLANLEDNGQIAVNITRPVDEKSLQVKGRKVSVREANEADRAVQELFRGALVEQLAFVGLLRGITRRLTWWPSVAIEIEVGEVFVQTPGPGAGRRLSR